MATRATALRSIPSVRQSRSAISRPRVDAIISRLVAAFSVVFTIQSVPAILAHVRDLHPVWLLIVGTAFTASVLGSLVASLLSVRVAASHALVAVVYFVALCTWPLAVRDAVRFTTDSHWMYHLLAVGVAAAAIGFSRWLAVAYLAVTATGYAVIRFAMQSPGSTLPTAALEALFAVILGGAIIVIVSMLRSASDAVDSAQSIALDRYAIAVRQHATEVERVQVDSIVHDSVLTTLLSAARATTAEEHAIATDMATNAIEHLREAALVPPDDGSTIRVTTVADRLETAARALSPSFEVRRRTVSMWMMPSTAAEAVHAAAVQAMTNSLQHAGPDDEVSRWVTIRAAHPAGIEIEVGDTGRGFVFVDVPSERLGVRMSIVERVANAGGTTEIDSVVGEGTVITIRWPRGERKNPSREPLIESFTDVAGVEG